MSKWIHHKIQLAQNIHKYTYYTSITDRSVRKVRVPNKILVGIYWSTILGVFLYVLIYTVLDEKGYQSFDNAVGASSTKVKGTASSSVGINTNINGYMNNTIYDAIDLVIPSIENDGLFITTGIVETPGQTRGICEGNGDVDDCLILFDIQLHYFRQVWIFLHYVFFWWMHVF